MNILKESYYFSNKGLKNTRVNKDNCEVIYSGVFDILKIDEKNINSRIYDRTAVMKIIEQFSSTSELYGCIDTVTNSFNIDIITPETSHSIKNMWIEGNILKAQIDVLDTMIGHEVLDLIKNNDVGFCTASIGIADSDGVVELERFITLCAVPKNDLSYEF